MHPTDLDLGEFVDDALDAAQRAAVAEHVDGCPACRTLVSDFLEIRRAASSLGTMEPPARTWMRIEQSLHEPSSRSLWSTSRRWPWLAAAAALVMAAAGSVWLVRAAHRSRNGCGDGNGHLGGG